MGIVEVLGRLRRLLHIRADLTRRFTELEARCLCPGLTPRFQYYPRR